MAQDNLQEVNAAIREVHKRAVVDAEFRQLAVRDAQAAMAAVKPGLKTPYQIKFVDNHGSSTRIVVLPDPVSGADALSAEELELVAGGSCEATSCGTSSIRQL